MKRRAVVRAVMSLVAATALAGCASGPEGGGWVVTSTHDYPEHTRVAFTGQCPVGTVGGSVAVQPVDCNRVETKYPELWEVCAAKGTERACWYTGSTEFLDQHVGGPLQWWNDDWAMLNRHPTPTNEWDAAS